MANVRIRRINVAKFHILIDRYLFQNGGVKSNHVVYLITNSGVKLKFAITYQNIFCWHNNDKCE